MHVSILGSYGELGNILSAREARLTKVVQQIYFCSIVSPINEQRSLVLGCSRHPYPGDKKALDNFLTLQSFRTSWKHHDRRHSYHSAMRGKYFTNRFYIKKCPGCSAWNNVAIAKCTQCLSPIGDDSIRLRMVDPLCLTANSRKEETEVDSSGCLVFYRCFDFSVVLNPQPVSAIHLTAVPNGTFYDIKNFRKNHILMLNKMKSQCEAIMRDIITGVQLPSFLSNHEHVLQMQQRVKTETGHVCASAVKEMLDHSICGFNYPSSFSHVEMHAILPPIRSFSIFKCPFFYPLSKILSDLEHLSQVKSYTPDEARQLYEKDIILDDIMDIDRTFKEKFHF